MKTGLEGVVREAVIGFISFRLQVPERSNESCDSVKYKYF
jgi:hypothetical protein